MNMQVGYRGEQVKQLQLALNRAGANLTVDGVYGSATKTAVMAFQSKYGLKVDGIAGPATQAKLDEVTKLTNNQIYNMLVTCLDAIEDLPEFKALYSLLEG